MGNKFIIPRAVKEVRLDRSPVTEQIGRDNSIERTDQCARGNKPSNRLAKSLFWPQSQMVREEIGKKGSKLVVKNESILGVKKESILVVKNESISVAKNSQSWWSKMSQYWWSKMV